MQTRNVILVVVALGVLGSCLIGSCLVWGLFSADEASPVEAATTPAEAPPADEPEGTGLYQCSATGMVYQCTGPNQCMYRTVGGFGSGRDRGQAAEMARLACNGQAIAMGGSAVCSVSCTLR
ncbi:MAG: hypothetical protein ACOZQL_39525 [Myxococcota bacterium]